MENRFEQIQYIATPNATTAPREREIAMEIPFVVHCSALLCSRCNGLMRFCACPSASAASPAAAGASSVQPPASAGTRPRAVEAPVSVIVWMAATIPARITICKNSGSRLKRGWYRSRL